LTLTTGLTTNRMIILDGLRKLRNPSAYDGEAGFSVSLARPASPSAPEARRDPWVDLP
jgi:hypothetical protein